MDILKHGKTAERPQIVDIRGGVKTQIVDIFEHEQFWYNRAQEIRAERKIPGVKKELSTEEIIELSSSPHVKSIKSGQISFTSEFKQILYEELAKGKMLRNVLREYGINPDILGDRRIYKLAERLRQQGKREGGFSDLRKNNGYKPAEKIGTQVLAAQVEKLRHELVYAQQEIEFLKKYEW